MDLNRNTRDLVHFWQGSSTISWYLSWSQMGQWVKGILIKILLTLPHARNICAELRFYKGLASLYCLMKDLFGVESVKWGFHFSVPKGPRFIYWLGSWLVLDWLNDWSIDEFIQFLSWGGSAATPCGHLGCWTCLLEAAACSGIKNQKPYTIYFYLN